VPTYKAVQVSEPRKLNLVQLPTREPGPGQVRLSVEACAGRQRVSATIGKHRLVQFDPLVASTSMFQAMDCRHPATVGPGATSSNEVSHILRIIVVPFVIAHAA
jgi:hypothetical protein